MQPPPWPTSSRAEVAVGRVNLSYWGFPSYQHPLFVHLPLEAPFLWHFPCPRDIRDGEVTAASSCRGWRTAGRKRTLGGWDLWVGSGFAQSPQPAPFSLEGVPITYTERRCRTPKSFISSAHGCCSPMVAPRGLPSRSLAAGWGCSLPSTGQLSTCGLFLQEVAFLEMMPLPDPC